MHGSEMGSAHDRHHAVESVGFRDLAVAAGRQVDQAVPRVLLSRLENYAPLGLPLLLLAQQILERFRRREPAMLIAGDTCERQLAGSRTRYVLAEGLVEPAVHGVDVHEPGGLIGVAEQVHDLLAPFILAELV